MPIFDFLHPGLPAGLPTVAMPVVDATDAALLGYGRLVDDPAQCQVEIVRWPSTGSRPVDEDTGDQAGTTEGVFVSEWNGDILYGRNEAVAGHYVLAYGTDPAEAREGHSRDPSHMRLWHANYHPDGGQLFFPLDPAPFYVPLALPGDDVTPQRFVCFRFAGDRGLYIHPGVWHEGVFAARGRQRFHDRQGAVHARVSVDFAREFGCLLGARPAALPRPPGGGACPGVGGLRARVRLPARRAPGRRAAVRLTGAPSIPPSLIRRAGRGRRPPPRNPPKGTPCPAPAPSASTAS